MTERKKVGLGMIISHGIGVAVGVVVYYTTSTPTIVPLAAGFVAAAVGTWLNIKINVPDIPE
jgi:hypothetical protein